MSARPPEPVPVPQQQQQQLQLQQQQAAAAAGQQQQQQLQRGHSVWLAPERFAAADFSPDQCVAELRRYVPLPTVKAELQQHLVRLKNKLVEALNEDYSDYVGLSGQLSGLEGAVVRMRQPLLEIQSKLSSVEDSLKAELHTLEQGLQRRKDAAAARATLELMQEVAASTSKVEKLLSEVASGQHTAAGAAAASSGPGAAGAAAGEGDASGDELEERCRMLLRVAGEAARLVFLAERGKQLAFVKSLERRIDGARFTLNRQLQSALAAALSARAWGAAGHCLRGFLELAEAGHAEEGLRQHLVGPLVRQVVTDVRQQQLQGGQAAAGSSPLSQVVALSLSRLRDDAGPLLAQLTAPGSGLGGIDLLGAVLLTELSMAVADGLPGLFSPGNPTAFQSNYLAGQALLGELEGLATSRAAVERLRASSAAAGWAKRWNLPVYFSLVYQDIAGTFEAAASASQLQPAADAKLSAPLPPLQHNQQPVLHFAVSACLWGCLQRTLAPNVFLQQLGDKFARLMTQLLVRYDTWLQELVRIRQQAGSAGPVAQAAAPAPQQQPSQTPGLQQQPGSSADGGAAAAGAGGGGGGEARSGQAAWVPDMPLDSAAVICSDADVLKALLQGPFVGQLQQCLEGLPSDAVQQLVGLMQDLAERIGQHGQQVLLLLAVDVLEHCVASVRQLKGITATYRMTAKGPPVRHSHYVAGVLQPLRQLLERAPVSTLPPHLKLLLARGVIDDVNGRYTALAEELLTSVKKTESSLKRLKKSRTGEAAAPGDAAAAMSDSDKIGLQLFLDVQEHGRQIARFGLVVEELDSFRQLLATVTPADKQSESGGQQQQPSGQAGA